VLNKEGGGVAPLIHFCTCQAEWLTSRPARYVQTQRQTGAFKLQRSVVYLLSLSCCVNRQTQPYRYNVQVIQTVVFVG
jgi:hypothetical protein